MQTNEGQCNLLHDLLKEIYSKTQALGASRSDGSYCVVTCGGFFLRDKVQFRYIISAKKDILNELPTK